jgi:hypothetical protein
MMTMMQSPTLRARPDSRQATLKQTRPTRPDRWMLHSRSP